MNASDGQAQVVVETPLQVSLSTSLIYRISGLSFGTVFAWQLGASWKFIDSARKPSLILRHLRPTEQVAERNGEPRMNREGNIDQELMPNRSIALTHSRVLAKARTIKSCTEWGGIRLGATSTAIIECVKPSAPDVDVQGCSVWNKVSGKLYLKMRESLVPSMGFRMPWEVSRNLMICAHSWISPLSVKTAADWSPCVGQCLQIQSTWLYNRQVSMLPTTCPCESASSMSDLAKVLRLGASAA
jgi:hypothetical protein